MANYPGQRPADWDLERARAKAEGLLGRISTEEMMVAEQRVLAEGPSTGLAYVLWFFLGLLSAHRFYLGRPLSAVLQIVSYFVLIGFVWLLIDAFLIPGMAREKRAAIREDALMRVAAMTRPHD